jgi:hypothetical protein
MHQRKIYEWTECFKKGRTSVMGESWPGHPSTSRTDQHIQRVDALIEEDRRLTLACVAQVRLTWWCPASGADMASWATENLFRRDKEAHWRIPEVHHCAGGLCRKVTCICSPSVELKLLSRNCLCFLIHLRNYTWRIVQVKKLLTMQFSSIFHHFIFSLVQIFSSAPFSNMCSLCSWHFNLATSWRWVVSFMPQPLNPVGKEPLVPTG